MNQCPKCGYTGNETACPYDGTPMNPAASANTFGQNQPPVSNEGFRQNTFGQNQSVPNNFVQNNGSCQNFDPNNLPPEYKPISMWGYFGYNILFAIPCVGFICLLMFAFGATNNINLKNYARSFFCFLIIGVVIFLFLLMTGALSAMFSRPYYY